MQDSYNELVVKPSSHRELFCELLLELTGEAIEERDDALIIRSENSLDEISWGVEVYAKELSKSLGENVEVALSIEKKDNQDWLEIYKNSITPIEVGDYFIKPTWSDECRDGKETILIDPALAFGSGHHETTSMCIGLLSEVDVNNLEVLDVGCGSGILSIIAAKRGGLVDICDTDELAIEESKKNFSLNGVSYVDAWVGSVTVVKKKYAIVIANIVADVLVMLAKDLYAALDENVKQPAKLLLSGVLNTNRDRVFEKFSSLGLSLEEERRDGEWVALLFRK